MKRTKLTFPALATLIALAATDARAQSHSEWNTDFSRHTVDLSEIVSAGPPKDGIPAIDRPMFVSVEEADRWLDDREPLALVAIGDHVKAYPLQILIWHEIVNDVVGGVPVVVTFCPLCNTTLAFDRRFNGRILDFGTTGRLRHSDLVMYDRQTESWWQQATGEGIVGEFAGERLTFISAPVVDWGTIKQSEPDAQILSRQTGYRRDYGDNPYRGYDALTGSPISRFFRARLDRRLSAMERVVAVSIGDEDVAYPFLALEDSRVVNDVAGGIEIVVFWAPGTASALDTRRISRGRDVGSTGVFRRQFGERLLTFTSAGDGVFRDRQTGSLWNVLGRATAGPLTGQRLDAVPHGNHFWFAWAAFRPDTRVER
ncbi:MAG: DUF3179 domain-containing protein [Gemmatimonadetes bacterium]|nr:DUF3179 domain-containing protein [Gemmatimonadota bacterium]